MHSLPQRTPPGRKSKIESPKNTFSPSQFIFRLEFSLIFTLYKGGITMKKYYVAGLLLTASAAAAYWNTLRELSRLTMYGSSRDQK